MCLKLRLMQTFLSNKLTNYKVCLVNQYLDLTSAKNIDLVKDWLCNVKKEIINVLKELVEFHIKLYLSLILLAVLLPLYVNTLIWYHLEPLDASVTWSTIIHSYIPSILQAFYVSCRDLTLWVVPLYYELCCKFITTIITLTLDLLEIALDYLVIGIYFVTKTYFSTVKFVIQNALIQILWPELSTVDCDNFATNKLLSESYDNKLKLIGWLDYMDTLLLVKADRTHLNLTHVFNMPVENGLGGIPQLNSWEEANRVSYFSNLHDLLENPVNYRHLTDNFITLKAVNNILNYTYSTVLSLYVIILFTYSVYRGINYGKITVVINTTLFLLFSLSAAKLAVGGESWAVSSDLKINNVLTSLNLFSFYYDNLTFTFLFTIYIISFVVHKYQFSYLNTSPTKENFLIMFNVFILSMVGVVSTSNWFCLLLSWEVLGLSSFLLIGYYKNKPAALKSALKAFTFNKLSDLFLFIAFALYYFTYGTFYFVQQPVVTPAAEWISTFILITAFIKSAQFCFYFWLPDSMEAPIPASALIHSATLVSAGIYLVLRIINLLELSNTSQYLLLVVPSITMVVTSLIAYNQTDIKKLLAYSTIANCGFIYFLIFLKAYKLALIYFVIHGVVKSFSFLVAGELIVENNHAQDIRKWVNFNLYTKLKLLFLALLLLLLSGIPLSMIYSIKSGLYYSNCTSGYTYTWSVVSLILYTLNSYLYGLKVILFMINKNIFYKKYRKFYVHTSDLHVHTNLLFVLYLSLLIGIVMITSFSVVTVGSVLSWKWLISFLLLTIGFTYTTLRDEIMYIQAVILVVFILNIIV